MFYLSVSNKKFADNIKSLGIVSPKSKNLRFPDLSSNDLELSFLLGFFDGDGSVDGELACGSYEFLSDIKKKFSLQNKIKQVQNHWSSCYLIRLPITLRRAMCSAFLYSLPRKRVSIDVPEKKELKLKPKPKEKLKPRSKRILKPRVFKVKIIRIKIDLAEMIEKLKELKSFKAVGKHFGLSGNAIKKRLIRNNIDFKSFLKIQKGSDHLDVYSIIQHYSKSKSLKDTAKAFQITSDRTQRIVKNSDTYKEMQNKKLEIKALKDKIIEMKKTMTFTEIAKRLNKTKVYIKGLYYT